MPRANPGEVWVVDLGLAAKVRPCLVLSDYPKDDELSLVIIVPHTTAVRKNRWEVSIPKTFFKTGVFHLQQLQSVPIVRLQRRIGELAYEELGLLRSKLSELLHLAPPAAATRGRGTRFVGHEAITYGRWPVADLCQFSQKAGMGSVSLR